MTLAEERAFEQIIARLNLIERSNNNQVDRRIYKYLFENFLFRLNLELEKWNLDNAKDYFMLLSDQFSREQKEIIAEKVPSIFYEKFGRGGYFLIHIYIYWELNSTKKTSKTVRNPFEPIIRIFELQGVINREGNSFEVGNSRFTLTSMLSNEFKFQEDLSFNSLNRIVTSQS